jgi:hypothetical protein
VLRRRLRRYPLPRFGAVANIRVVAFRLAAIVPIVRLCRSDGLLRRLLALFDIDRRGRRLRHRDRGISIRGIPIISAVIPVRGIGQGIECRPRIHVETHANTWPIKMSGVGLRCGGTEDAEQKHQRDQYGFNVFHDIPLNLRTYCTRFFYRAPITAHLAISIWANLLLESIITRCYRVVTVRLPERPSAAVVRVTDIVHLLHLLRVNSAILVPRGISQNRVNA